MKKIMKYSLSMMALALAGFMGACNEFTPETPELPDLPKASNLQASVSNRVVTLNWTLPASSLKINGVVVKVNNNQEITLDPTATSYSVKGQPMEDEYLYTVKVKYDGGYISEGVSTIAVVPYEELADVTNLMVTDIQGRTVTLSWNLPNVAGITGVFVGLDGNDVSSYSFYEGDVTSVTLKSQPSGASVRYRVLVQYDNYYNSNGSVCPADIPYVETKMGYLLLADSPAALEDDDEKAAAAWFSDLNNTEFIKLDQVADLDPEEVSVLWIMVDRVGLEYGWQNLPDGLGSDAAIEALKAYGAKGGNLYLAKMATQLTEPLNIVPAGMGPTIWGNGEGGSGDDVWTINPYLGWDFQNNPDIDFYDRTAHQIYQGLLFDDPNGYGYMSIPLEGPGFREDHNTMWDCNIYGAGAYNNVIQAFEATTNSLVLATWGHVRDHCVAGLVDFNPNAEHGRVIANGFSAYEFNQNSGVNPYQSNVEGLTLNILNYLK